MPLLSTRGDCIDCGQYVTLCPFGIDAWGNTKEVAELRCLECELCRAAHVMAWAAFADFIQELISLNLSSISAIRKTWDCTSVDTVVEKYPESQLIDALADAKVFTKNERKALQGLLSKRNECAHPSEYFPGLNETLGYVSELLFRLEAVKKRCKI